MYTFRFPSHILVEKPHFRYNGPVHNAHTFLHLHLPRPPRLGLRGRLLVAASLLATAYAVGFALFVTQLPQPFTTLPPELDGLAVFTGGAGRVEATLAQVQQGFQGPILISGSHSTTRLADILAETTTRLTAAQRTHILHDAAQTTRQNILSLKAWAGYHHLETVGIVTSTYHAPRVALLAALRARNLQMVLLPVQPVDPGLTPLWREYNKLLLAPFLR